MSEPRIIIEVLGGVVQGVHSDAAINVDVLDWDNAEGDAEETERAEKLSREINHLKRVL